MIIIQYVYEKYKAIVLSLLAHYFTLSNSNEIVFMATWLGNLPFLFTPLITSLPNDLDGGRRRLSVGTATPNSKCIVDLFLFNCVGNYNFSLRSLGSVENVSIVESDFIANTKLILKDVNLSDCDFFGNTDVTISLQNLISSCLNENNYLSISGSNISFSVFSRNRDIVIALNTNSNLEHSLFRENVNTFSSLVSLPFSDSIFLIRNTSFFFNSAQSSYGGYLIGILANHAFIKVVNSVFNHSLGGCIYLSSFSQAVIESSIFVNSFAFSSSGGAIFVKAASSVLLSDCVFQLCISFGFGGILFVDSLSNVTALHCSFLDSFSALKGGATGFLIALRYTAGCFFFRRNPLLR
jgi:hypothetical protein